MLFKHSQNKINLRLIKFTVFLRTYEYDMQVFDNITCSTKLGVYISREIGNERTIRIGV